MNLPTLHRRTVVGRGAVFAGALVLAGRSAQATPASARASPDAVNGPLIGWLVISPDGGSRLTIFEVDARSVPVRQVMTTAGGPATSVASAIREANNTALRTVASLLNVSAEDCSFIHRGIRNAKSGQIVPFSIWTDFA
jgi:hypothetical protein